MFHETIHGDGKRSGRGAGMISGSTGTDPTGGDTVSGTLSSGTFIADPVITGEA